MIINRKAIFQGTAIFIVLYFIHLMILPALAKSGQRGEDGAAIFGLHQRLGVATCLISGFFGARIAGERGFFYGFNVGALGTVISALAAILWAALTGAKFPPIGMLPFWIVVNGFLAAFAGLFAVNFGAAAETKDRQPDGS